MRKEGRKKSDDARVGIEESNGNVFADLGLKNPDELLAKAQLVQRPSRTSSPSAKLNAGPGGEASGCRPTEGLGPAAGEARGLLNRPPLPVPECLGL